MTFQHGGGTVREIALQGGVVKDGLFAFYDVIRWCFFPEYNSFVVWALVMLVLASVVAALIGGSVDLRAYTAVNLTAWFFYYFVVKLGVYADMDYGGFGNRYNLFFLPLWISWGFLALPELYRMIAALTAKLPSRLLRLDHPRLFAGGMACFLAASSFAGWSEQIQPNWEKDHIREAVSHWYEEEAQQTLVYYASCAGFAYYLRMNPGYTEESEDAVHYMKWLYNRSAEEYRMYLNGVYGEVWPEDLTFVASHFEDDLFTILQVFEAEGYERRDAYNGGDAVLICLTRTADAPSSPA